MLEELALALVDLNNKMEFPFCLDFIIPKLIFFSYD